jgi:hypothetical protein
MSDSLGTYLKDHYAGSTLGVDLARRLEEENAGEPKFADLLARVAAEIEEDRETLKAIMESLDVSTDPLKTGMAWATEKAARLKMHGRSDLSRVLELESLLGGVEGKLGLWRALRIIAPSEPRLDASQIAELFARAEHQIEVLRDLQGLAAEEAFAPGAVEHSA